MEFQISIMSYQASLHKGDWHAPEGNYYQWNCISYKDHTELGRRQLQWRSLLPTFFTLLSITLKILVWNWHQHFLVRWTVQLNWIHIIIQLFRSWLLQPTRKCPETSTEAVQLSLLLLTRAAETMMLWGLPHLILILDNVKVPVFDTNGEYLHML